MSTEDTEHEKMNDLRWKTTVSRKVEEFQRVISRAGEKNDYFDLDYVSRLNEKSKELSNLGLKLSLLYFLLMLSLYLSKDSGDQPLNLFGYSLENLGKYKEFILFCAAAVVPFMSVNYAYKSYLDALKKECLRSITGGGDVYEYYKHAWLNEPWDALLKPRKISDNIYSHKVIGILLIIFLILILVIAASFYIGAFLLQMLVVFDVATNPSSDKFTNTFVVIFTVSSILLSWVVTILRAPLPENDYSIYEKLNKLKSSSEEDYTKSLSVLAKRKDFRRFIVQIAYALTCYLAVYCYVLYQNWTHGDGIEFSWHLFLQGASIAIASSVLLMEFVNKLFEKIFFTVKFKSRDSEIEAFMVSRRWVRWVIILVPLLNSIYLTYDRF